jgi:hypothetical protein
MMLRFISMLASPGVLQYTRRGDWKMWNQIETIKVGGFLVAMLAACTGGSIPADAGAARGVLNKDRLGAKCVVGDSGTVENCSIGCWQFVDFNDELGNDTFCVANPCDVLECPATTVCRFTRDHVRCS